MHLWGDVTALSLRPRESRRSFEIVKTTFSTKVRHLEGPHSYYVPLFLALWYLTAAVQIFSTLVKSYPKEKILPPTFLKWLMSALSHLSFFSLSPLVNWAMVIAHFFHCHVLRFFAVLFDLYFKERADQSNWWMDFESQKENSRTMTTFLFFLTEYIIVPFIEKGTLRESPKEFCFRYTCSEISIRHLRRDTEWMIGYGIWDWQVEEEQRYNLSRDQFIDGKVS